MIIVHVLTRLLKAGSEENTLLTCRGQVEDGHTVYVMFGKDFDPSVRRQFDEASITTLQVKTLVHPINPALDFRAVRDMSKLFRKLGADVVHTHQSKAGILGRIAARLAKVKTIIHGVHILPFVNVSKIQEFVYVAAERYCAAFTNAFVNVSPFVRQACIDKGIGHSENHFVAYSAMDLDKFRNYERPDDWLNLMNLTSDENEVPVAVMVAAFEPRKRQLDFIRCLPSALSALPNWRVLFVGSGEREAEARNLVAELGLADRVRFSGYRNDPQNLIGMSDVCVLTSEREGLPRVVVQYIAAGKPVVVSHVPGIEDIVTDGVNSIITPAQDVTAAASAVGILLADERRRKLLSEGAKLRDVSSWLPSNMHRSIKQAYEYAKR